MLTTTKQKHTLNIERTCPVLKSRELLKQTIEELPADTEIVDIQQSESGWCFFFETAEMGPAPTLFSVKLVTKPQLVRQGIKH